MHLIHQFRLSFKKSASFFFVSLPLLLLFPLGELYFAVEYPLRDPLSFTEGLLLILLLGLARAIVVADPGRAAPEFTLFIRLKCLFCGC